MPEVRALASTVRNPSPSPNLVVVGHDHIDEVDRRDTAHGDAVLAVTPAVLPPELGRKVGVAHLVRYSVQC